jgi:hypothetical protein
VRNGKQPWEIDADDRAALRCSLEKQFYTGLVSYQHYCQVSAEIGGAQYRTDLKAAGRSLPYEAQVAWSAALVKLAVPVAFGLVTIAEPWWLLLIPGASLVWCLVKLGVLRPLLGRRIADLERRERRAARFAGTPALRHTYEPTL